MTEGADSKQSVFIVCDRAGGEWELDVEGES